MRPEVEVAVCCIAEIDGAVSESEIRRAINVLRDEERVEDTVEDRDSLIDSTDVCSEGLDRLVELGVLERVVGARDVLLGYTSRSVSGSTSSRKQTGGWGMREKETVVEEGTVETKKRFSAQALRMECIRMILEADETIPRDRIEKALAVLAGRYREKPEVVSPEEAMQMAGLSKVQYSKAVRKGYLARVIRGPVKGGTFVGICRESVDRYIAGQYIGK